MHVASNKSHNITISPFQSFWWRIKFYRPPIKILFTIHGLENVVNENFYYFIISEMSRPRPTHFCAIKSSCETFLNQALLKTFQFDFHCFHGWLKLWIKITNFISLSQYVKQLFWQCFHFSFYKIWAKPIGRLMRYLRNTSRTSTFSNQMQTDFRKISVTTSDASEVKNGKLFFWLLTFQS